MAMTVVGRIKVGSLDHVKGLAAKSLAAEAHYRRIPIWLRGPPGRQSMSPHGLALREGLYCLISRDFFFW